MQLFQKQNPAKQHRHRGQRAAPLAVDRQAGVLVDAAVVDHDIRRFKQLTRTAKVRLVTFTALLYILIHALVTGTIPYFLLLMMLGIDYLIYDNQPPK